MIFFLPGVKALGPGMLAACGLEGTIIQRCQVRETLAGPEGGGMLISDERDCSIESFTFSSDQIWIKRFDTNSWICASGIHKPTPEQLAREVQIPGVDVELIDGRKWRIPVLRQWKSDNDQLQFDPRLPRLISRSPQGWMVGDVIPKYRSIWNLSLKVGQILFDQITGSANKAELDDTQLVDYAVEVLALNYRVDVHVVSAAELLSSEIAGLILRSSLDWDAMRAFLKNRLSRSDLSGTSTRSGETQPTEASNTLIAQP